METIIAMPTADEFSFLPEKNNMRDYTEKNEYFDRVKHTYFSMHANQTYEYVQTQISKWCKFDHTQLSVMEALDLLNTFVDESDPDVNIPNIIHAYQTAERIRELHPDNEWFQLTGLIHDLGKIMAMFGEPQWAVVGDTFPVGCQFSNKIVFGTESFQENSDSNHPVYGTKLGIYKEHCGLEQVLMSWGHDEYLYRVIKNHPTSRLPEESLYMIRFHSFYPWHKESEYMHLCSDKDREMLKWVQQFNSFDLYSKTDAILDIDALKPYYQSLADKYLPGKICF